MKIMVPLVILIMLACANLAFSQAAPSYSPAQAQPIYGPPQPQPVYGAPQAQLTYGPQQPGPAYGAPQAQQYGPAPVQSYGSQQAQSSLYDTSYNGLFNMYGQPTFLAPQYPAGARQQAQQQQQGQDGLIFRGAAALESAGSYLWGYMPAPLRGADKGYFGAAGNGPTIINFVPGAP
jgi:hypothetical protein